ncbi:hypothetical protein [Yoonia litorea]|uniref:Uncharacterized protein n=1 Tax=Yoonia litorea TaxID=1123755 RepID=A0A1I6MDT0_9RHOB|nr:hypothetical protein [Yoonia litorea]SFS13748.1 hypothetical protein SAMN05444714_1599 [Yoonia litorea]
MKGKRFDLPRRPRAAPHLTLSEDEWNAWEALFRVQGRPQSERVFSDQFRDRVQVCLEDFVSYKEDYFDPNRISPSDLRKKIKRLTERDQKGQELDDPETLRQLFMLVPERMATFAEKAELALLRHDTEMEDSAQEARKPEVVFTKIIYERFKEHGARVVITGGWGLSQNGYSTVHPTSIEQFILKYIWEIDHPLVKDVDRIRKIIRNYFK